MKPGTFRRPLFACVFAGAAVLLSASTVRAETDHVYRHGSACKPENPASVIKHNQWGAYNDSSSPAWVICDLGFTTGSSTMQFFLRAWDDAASSKLGCTFVVADQDGYTKWSSALLTTTGSDGSKPESLSVTTPIVQGYAYVRCSMPGKETGHGPTYISSVHKASF